MSPVTLSAFLALLALSAAAQEPSSSSAPSPTTTPAAGPPPPTNTKQQFPATPLAERRFEYPNGIPYKVDTEDLLRGIQVGYNQCNQTTEGQDSLCQTGFLNSLDDFCLWAPPEPDSLIADTEGEAVAWCTKPGRGTRLIPAGTLTGVQFIRTPDYIQVAGFIEQSNINIQKGDYGGELDPHGADLRGNPLGGLVFSNAWNTNKNEFKQVVEWHNFVGGDAFCFKACDPAGPNAARFCEHIFDRIGCAYNAPNNAKKGVFESCLGENQDFPGVYTTNGQVVTYTQPAESLGPITTIPYTARMPASSSCSTFSSAQIFSALPSASGASSAKATATGSGTSKASGSGTRTGSAAGASATGTNGASTIVMSTFGVFGAIFSAIVLL